MKSHTSLVAQQTRLREWAWKSILKAFAINPDHVKRKANRQSAQYRYTQLK